MSGIASFQTWQQSMLLKEESAKKVITHLTHLEDLVVTQQARGASEAVDFVTNLIEYFKGNANAPVNISVKIDGAPAIVVGTDPEDGRFFIGTKGAFSKVPKIAKSVEDLNTLYAGKEGLIEVMRTAFTALQPLRWTGIYQGDVLFTPQLKQIRTIDGTEYVTFKPNTIMYGVPTDTDLGRQIMGAKFGVSFHTEYKGDSLATVVAQPNPNIEKLQSSKDAVFISSRFRDLSGIVSFTKPEMAELTRVLRSLRKRTDGLSANPFVRALGEISLLQSEFMVFQNTLVRRGEDITLSPKTFGKQFVLFLATRQRELSAKKKSDAGIAGVSARYKQIAQFITDNYEAVVDVLAWQRDMTEMKSLLLKKLNTPAALATFYQHGEGVVAGPHEGFVGSDSIGNFYKLVDRSYFSRINLTHGRFSKDA